MDGNEARTFMMPHYAALLANICQVELQLGKNALYRQLLKLHVLQQDSQLLIETPGVRCDILIMPFKVCFAV